MKLEHAVLQCVELQRGAKPGSPVALSRIVAWPNGMAEAFDNRTVYFNRDILPIHEGSVCSLAFVFFHRMQGVHAIQDMIHVWCSSSRLMWRR